MGRGRAKAKQTNVARELEYQTHETDVTSLANELHGESHSTETDQVDPEVIEKWSDYVEPRRD
jgi:hypothetical protein